MGWNSIFTTDFSSMLNNDYKATFVNAVAPYTGYFDDMECLGEFLTRYSPTKGAVGYIGYSRHNFWFLTSNINLSQRFYPEMFPDYLLNKKVSIAGELLQRVKTEGLPASAYLGLQARYGLNYFGDPALNILADGYAVTENMTLCDFTIPHSLYVRNNATITISSNCNLNLETYGKLIIEEDGNLVIGNAATITGGHGITGPQIRVIGGNITVGYNATFQDLDGISIETTNKDQPPYTNKMYTINNAVFNNTPLTHNGSNLSLSNCFFNFGSDVYSSNSQVFIDNCKFNNNTIFISN
jgi:hypothetical protein